MTTTNYTRSQVATLANALHYQQGFTLSAAWTKAWKVIKLKAAMREGTATFAYTKKDGSTRPAVGTTSPALTGYTPKADAPARKYSPLYVRYYDTTAEGFRQFAAARLQ
jgi:hypothetical protein